MSKPKPPADRDEFIGEIDDIVGFHIRRAHGSVYRHFTETFADLGLTQKQVSVLWLVSDHPAIAQTELAQRLQLDRATVMAIVNRLQERGFLVRGASSTDRRMQTLHLSAPGEQALQAAKAAVREHETWLKSRFSTAEVRTLIALLRRIHG